MKFVEEGEINLDSSLAYYLPQYKFPKANKITVRMLGNMTSWMFSFTEDNEWLKENLVSNYETVYTPDSLIKVSLKHSLDFEPGTKFNYNNNTPILLGFICKKVTCKSL